MDVLIHIYLNVIQFFFKN